MSLRSCLQEIRFDLRVQGIILEMYSGSHVLIITYFGVLFWKPIPFNLRLITPLLLLLLLILLHSHSVLLIICYVIFKCLPIFCWLALTTLLVFLVLHILLRFIKQLVVVRFLVMFVDHRVPDYHHLGILLLQSLDIYFWNLKHLSKI